jgi:hypothetical protein
MKGHIRERSLGNFTDTVLTSGFVAGETLARKLLAELTR